MVIWEFNIPVSTEVQFNELCGQKRGQNMILFATHCLEHASTNSPMIFLTHCLYQFRAIKKPDLTGFFANLLRFVTGSIPTLSRIANQPWFNH